MIVVDPWLLLLTGSCRVLVEKSLCSTSISGRARAGACCCCEVYVKDARATCSRRDIFCAPLGEVGGEVRLSSGSLVRLLSGTLSEVRLCSGTLGAEVRLLNGTLCISVVLLSKGATAVLVFVSDISSVT